MVYEPPSQPPAGWYPDPHLPGSDRYWNGRAWEERWRPAGGAVVAPAAVAAHGLPDIGQWLSRAFNRALERWRAATIVALVTSAIPMLLFLGAIAYLIDDVIITTEGDVVGWSNGRLPLAILLGLIALVLGLSGIFAMQALMLRAVDEADAVARGAAATIVEDDDTPATRALDAIGTSVRTLPRAIGWFFLFALGLIGVVVVFVIAAATAPLLAVLAAIAALPVVLYLVIRWSFTGVALVDGPGNPFARSAQVVRGRWWPIFGRLLLIVIITGVLGAAVNSSTSIASGGDGFGNQTTIELDSSGDLTEDLALADLFPTTIWPIILTVIGQLLVNVISAVSLAGMSELYRTRHPTRALGAL